jgi:hypothetical protein
LGRSLSLLILEKIITSIANLGSKKAGLGSDFLGNCMILIKENFNWKKAFYWSLLFKLENHCLCHKF